MSTDPNQPTAHGISVSDAQREEQARKQIQQLTEEIAQLSEADISHTILQRRAPAHLLRDAGLRRRAVNPHAAGNLQQQCQINLREVGLERTPESRPMQIVLHWPSCKQRRHHQPHFSTISAAR